MRQQMINSYLKAIKVNFASKNYTFISRAKNVAFMRDNNLDTNDLEDIIFDLSHRDCIDGPEPDRDGYDGWILEFKSTFIEHMVIYIKIRCNPPNDVIIISFHEDE